MYCSMLRFASVLLIQVFLLIWPSCAQCCLSTLSQSTMSHAMVMVPHSDRPSRMVVVQSSFDGSSKTVDMWCDATANADKFGPTVTGQPRYERCLEYFTDVHPSDYERSPDGRIRVHWSRQNGTRTIMTHPLNKRQNESQVMRLVTSVREQRLAYAMRSPPFVAWSPGRTEPLLTFAWGHLVDAVYHCSGHYRETLTFNTFTKKGSF